MYVILTKTIINVKIKIILQDYYRLEIGLNQAIEKLI
jgi:hypothetical protein